MSLPTDSVAPAPPTGTSNPWSLVQWWKRICDWIAGLSPSGADKYDTGWVDITPLGSFSSTGAQVRRIGRALYFKGFLSGAALSTAGTNIGTVPPGFRPPGGTNDTADAVALGNGAVARAVISAAGVITVIPPANATTAVFLKGLSGCTID